MTSNETPVTTRFSRFRHRSQWFLAELVIIVAGVLIALAIDELRNERGNALLERQYLDQLTADLSATADLITVVVTVDAEAETSGLQFLALFEDDNPESAQEAGHWLSEMRTFNTPVPVLGTIEALISTGDLRLIKDPIARAAITQYLSSAQNRSARYEQYENLSRELYIRILILAQAHGVTPSHRSGLAGAVPDSDAAAFFTNPEAYALADRFVGNKAQMARHRDAMLAEAIELRELLVAPR